MDHPATDFDLLTAYARTSDQAAFAQIVKRHAALVYSAALRQVGPQQAEDVSQAVFFILSRKAKHINGQFLAGWLVKAARLAGMAAHRMEHRRSQRQHEAAVMHQQIAGETPAHDHWNEISPLLDKALSRLGERDRCAVTLRFLEGKSVREVAAAMKTSEAAAAKRYTRAITKLRDYFIRHGFRNVTRESLGQAMSVYGMVPAPLGLATKLAATGAISASAAGIAKGTLALMLTAKTKLAALATCAVVLAGGAGALIIKHLTAATPIPVVAQLQTELPAPRTTILIQASPDVAPDDPIAPTTQPAPEIFTREQTPPGAQPTFTGRVEGLLNPAGAEIGVIYLKGTHWLNANNYQWQPLGPNNTFTITADRVPGVRRALAVRSTGQSVTFLRAEFDADESASNIVIRMMPTRPVSITIKNARNNPPPSNKIEIFTTNRRDDEGNMLNTQRITAPVAAGGRITLPLPLEPVSFFISGTGVAPYSHTIDPRAGDRFEFKLLDPANISGTVTNHGKPVVNTRVVLSNPAVDFSTVYRKTDANGHFQLTGGIPGTYDISVKGKTSTVKFQPGPNEPIKIELSKLDPAPTAEVPTP